MAKNVEEAFLLNQLPRYDLPLQLTRHAVAIQRLTDELAELRAEVKRLKDEK